MSLNPMRELPKILLVGKNGQVGWELRRTLAPVGVNTGLSWLLSITPGTSVDPKPARSR